MRENELKNTIKVGFFLTFLIFIVMLFVAFIGKENAIFSKKALIKSHALNAQNLKTGAMVQLKGLKIGKVQKINIISMEKVEIVIEVDHSYLTWIKTDSKTSITSAGLVGDKFLEIVGGSDAAPSVTETDILGNEAPISIDQFANKGENIMISAGSVLVRLDNILAQIEKKGNLVDTIEHLNLTLAKVDKILGDVDSKKINGTISNIEKTTARFDQIGQRIEQGPGTVHSFIYDEILHSKLMNVLGGAERNKVLKYFIRKSVEDSDKK